MSFDGVLLNCKFRSHIQRIRSQHLITAKVPPPQPTLPLSVIMGHYPSSSVFIRHCKYHIKMNTEILDNILEKKLSLSVFILHYLSSSVIICHYLSLSVFIRLYPSLSVFIRLHLSLSVIFNILE